MRPYRHCPWCGEPLPPPAGSLQRCRVCGEPIWLNPKPCAGAIVVRDDASVLLTRRARDPFRGYWDIPGGYVEPHETFEQCVRRELREETGLDVRVGRYLGAFPDTYGPGGDATLNVYFEASVVGGSERPADDVDLLAWFSPEALPPADEIAFENGPLALQAWLRTRSAPGR